ncbi:histidinol-phosphatase [Halobacteriales archaeon QS_3_64_16]|nr:MAG: histidinol-phosphatase [Halobacteriales archaeon QS_3_64_16]
MTGSEAGRNEGGSTDHARRYDLQVHTDASPCSAATPAQVARAASEANLDGIAITNHDTTEGIREVRRAASGLSEGIDVISGVEVTTTQGHLLALNVAKPPPQADPLTVIENIHEQGGLAVLSHPFDRFRQVYDRDLEAIAAAIDGIETRNSRCVRPRYNRAAEAFAARHGLAETGGSDGHFPREVGRAATECRGDVLDSIRAGETRVVGRGGYLSGHVATKVHQVRGLLG